MSGNPFLDMAGIDPAQVPALPQAPVAARGVRNNNPGNLRWDGQSQWQGMVGVDPDGFVQFDTPENGQRALGINLANQPRLHGLDTVRGIIGKYAPRADGNDTARYVATVAQNLGVGPDDQIDPTDPRVNRALQAVIVPTELGGGLPAGGSPPSGAPARNPFLEMAGGATNAGYAGASSHGSDFGAQGGSAGVYSDAGGGGDSGPDPRLEEPAAGEPSAASTASRFGHWAAGLDPLSNKLVNGVPIGQSLRDSAVGLMSGAASVPETLIDAAAYVVDKTGAKRSAEILRGWSKGMERGINSLAADPNSTMFKSRELAGMIGATAPVAEITPLTAAARSARAGKLASALARYGDMAAQGAAAGALTSRGENVGENMAAGAVLAPALGVAVDKVLPVGIAAFEKASGSKLAQALRSRMSSASTDTAGAEATASGDAVQAAKGWTPDEIAQGWRKGPDGNPEFADQKIIRRGSDLPPAMTADGRLQVEINGGVPEAPQTGKPPIDPATLAAAVRAAGNKGGEITPASYVDAYLAGKGRGDAPEDLALQQYAADNGPAIEAEFRQRADTETRGGYSPETSVAPGRTANTLAAAREAAGEFVGQPIANDATGVEATVSRGTLGKMTSSSAAGKSSSASDHALAVANADQLFKGAQLINRYADPRGEPTVQISRWRSYMETPAGPRGVKMTVKETAHPGNPNPLYTIETMEVEPAPQAPRNGIEPEPGQNRYSGAPGSDANIAEPAAAANAIEDLKAAMGSRGARRGLESDTNWPESVRAHANRLVRGGMPIDQALREAEISFVGGQPTLANVTRNPADQRAMWEGAKQDTIEGQQLATQIANNNAALHTTLQHNIAELGSAPAEGEAAQEAARSLARSADREREHVQKLYHEAAQSGGEVRVKPEEVFAAVGARRAKAAVTNEGRNFIRGMTSRLMDMTRNGRLGLSAPELDQLHQHASYAFDPTAPQELNKLIWEVKDAINHHLDQIGEAGPAYARARAAHRAWAEKYENPEGVRRLIARNVEGMFKHEDNWRRAEGLVTALGDRPFIQVVRQLKANGDTRTVNRMKAAVIQSAYEYATGARGGNAVDQLGNSPVSGKLFLAKLNAIGMPKLKALFSAAELGRLATIGRAAAHLNEAVPGTVNTSGTSSALLNALRKIKGVQERRTGVKSRALDAALLIGGQVVGHTVMPGVGGVVVGTAGNVAKGVAESAAETAARKELAEHLRRMMDPSVARAADRAAARRTAEQLRRRATAQTISNRTPPIVGSAQQQQRRK